MPVLTENVTVKKVRKSTRLRPGLWFVYWNGKAIGEIEKRPNTLNQYYPYKAFKGTRHNREYRQAFYDKGGFGAALQCVLDAAMES